MSFALRKKFVDASYVPEKRTRLSRVSTQRLEQWEKHRHEIASFEQWMQQQREVPAESERLHQLAELLTPMFLFLAAGAKPAACSKTGTLHQRAWVLLYAVRADLLDGETMAAAAERYGVTIPRLMYLLREFRRYLPDYARPAIHAKAVATEHEPEEFEEAG